MEFAFGFARLFLNSKSALVFSVAMLGAGHAQAQTYYVPALKREATSVQLNLPTERIEMSADVDCRVLVKAGRGYDADKNSVAFSSHKRVVKVPRTECKTTHESSVLQDKLGDAIAEDYGLQFPVFEYEPTSVRAIASEDGA